MTELLSWAFQGLVLTIGIFVFLRIVRTARGSRIVRGVVVTMIGGVLSLWALSSFLALQELEYLIELVAGFVVVIFAVLFQPELRRAIAQLGEGAVLCRLMRSMGRDALHELCQALAALAARRTGALVAIERENPLDAYIAGGVRMDALVGRMLIESVFQTKSALHDGAVIVREDRVAAASCLFPLTEDLTVARSLGTRHRAALGLTEECDAVVLVVSEETGGISLAKRGQLTSVSAGKLEEVLRAAIDPEQGAEERSETGAPSALREFLRRDLIWLGAAMVLAAALVGFAHQKLRTEREFTLTLVHTKAGDARLPRPGELLVRIGGENIDLYRQNTLQPQLSVSTSRDAINALSASGLAGVVAIENPQAGEMAVSAGDIEWVDLPLGTSVQWLDDEPLRLSFRAMRTLEIDLGEQSPVVDDSALDKRYESHPDQAVFDPDHMSLYGPSEILDGLEDGSLALALEPVILGQGDRGERRERVRLAEELEESGVDLRSEHTVMVPISAARIEIDTIDVDVAMLCLDPARVSELDSWSLPSDRARVRYRISCAGLILAEPGTTAFDEFRLRVVDFVRENLVAYVDISEVQLDGPSKEVTLRELWRLDWRESPDSFLLDEEQLSPFQELTVELDQSDGARILLEPRS